MCIYIYISLSIYIYIYSIAAVLYQIHKVYSVGRTMLADLRARAARVCWYTCTGCTAKKIQLFSERLFLSGATRTGAPTFPCSPCA